MAIGDPAGLPEGVHEAIAASPWALLEGFGDGAAVSGADGTLVYSSASLAAIARRPAVTLSGASIFDLFDAASAAALRTPVRAAAEVNAMHRCVVSTAVGGSRLQVVLRGLQLTAGRFVVWSFARVAEAIDYSDGKYTQFVQGTDFSFWDIDLGTDTVQWSSDWCERLDIDPCTGAAHGERWQAQIHPADLGVLASFERAAAGVTDTYEHEYRVRTLGGAWRWVQSRGRVVMRDATGRALQISGVILDIDTCKRNQVALRESEARLETAVWGTGIGVWESAEEGRFLWLNDWCTSLDIDPCDRPNGSAHWRSRIHPEDLEPFARLTQACQDGTADHYVVEYRTLTLGGRWRWLHERGKVVERNPYGPTHRYVGVCFDIDARKRMETALRAAEVRYDVSIHAAQLPVWEYDVRKDLVRGNVYLRRITDREATEEEAHAYSETWLSNVHPQDVPILENVLTECSQDGKASFEMEFRIRTPAGTYRWQLDRGRVTEWDADGKPLTLVGISLDIDARKRMELALRTQGLILETMNEGVVLLGADGGIEYTNPAFDRLIGRKSGELLGMHAMDLLKARTRSGEPSHLVERLIRRYGALAAGRQVDLSRADGTRFAAEVLTAKIEMHGETKALCVIQDITERKRLEQQVTEATYHERQRLGSDLHDGLGQELTGIALLLRSVAQMPHATSAIKTRLDEVIGLVNHAIDSTRAIASGLSPVRLARGGLVSALRALSEWSQASYGIHVQLRLGLRCELNLDEASATHLYLIAQEAIVNAAKHGRSRQVILGLRVNRELISLSADDDGIGLGGEPRRPQNAGMGLKIMQYRAGAVGGSLHVKRRRRGGTRVHCVCPHAPR